MELKIRLSIWIKVKLDLCFTTYPKIPPEELKSLIIKANF